MGGKPREYFDDAVRGGFETARSHASRDLVLRSRGDMADGSVVDGIAAIHAVRQNPIREKPLHESIDELVDQSVAGNEENAFVFVGLVGESHVLRVCWFGGKRRKSVPAYFVISISHWMPAIWKRGRTRWLKTCWASPLPPCGLRITRTRLNRISFSGINIRFGSYEIRR